MEWWQLLGAAIVIMWAFHCWLTGITYDRLGKIEEHLKAIRGDDDE